MGSQIRFAGSMGLPSSRVSPPLWPFGGQRPCGAERDRAIYRCLIADPLADASFLFLGPAAAAGATINPATGVFSYTPPAGPATASFMVIVTDNGSRPLGTAHSFTLTVNGVNPQR